MPDKKLTSRSYCHADYGFPQAMPPVNGTGYCAPPQAGDRPGQFVSPGNMTGYCGHSGRYDIIPQHGEYHMMEEDYKMSIIAGICNKNGVAIAADGKATCTNGSSFARDGYRGSIPKVFKIGEKDPFLLGTCGSNVVYREGELVYLEDAIGKLAENHDQGWEPFLRKMEDYLYGSDTFSRAGGSPEFQFLFGVREKHGWFPYRLLQYKFSVNGTELLFSSNGAYLRQMGAAFTIHDLTDFSDFPVDGLRDMAGKIVETAIRAGEMFVENNLSGYCPVGGKIRRESLP